MNAATNTADPIKQAKAALKRDFPGWNIVYSNERRLWGFRDPELRWTDPGDQVTAVVAETAGELRKKLTAAEEGRREVPGAVAS
ncbi:hypothetical protein [Actinomadura sp. 3N508]|uniref:hypothetical protein n=1 Tax=Actinomadura sp. 3N508 TaxID=3375153 RepID=UPI0037B1D608